MAVDPAMIQAAIAARKKLIELFPVQSTVGRAMRAFDSAGDPISGAINMVSSLFKGSKYRGGQYLLGEKYMLYVLGIDIHDRKKVPDEMVQEAIDFMSALFGVPILTGEALNELKADIELYKKNRPEGRNSDPLALQKAKELLNRLPWDDRAGSWQSALASMAESDTSQSGLGAQIGTALGIPPGSEGIKKWIIPVVGIVLLLLFLRLFKSKSQ
jgi:hypothetical protein